MEEKVEGQCFCCGAGPQITAIAKAALPTEALDHFKASQVEFLKGIRHLLDARIQKMNASKQHGSSIPVE